MVQWMALMVTGLLAATAMAQGFGRGRGGGMGGRWANVSAADQQKVTNLHQQIRQAQWDLWTLQSQKAAPDAVKAQEGKVLKLRGELAKLMTGLPPCPAYQAGQGMPPQGAGLGPGRGRGPGYGRGAGCPWRQAPR
jgi:hypothetical protein